MQKRIFLLGYMGSGKTTMGKLLASELDMIFIDLDELIEQKTHKTISDIFEEQGEDGFRRIERKELLEIVNTHNAVIALGGGTPCYDNNIDLIKEKGDSIYLKQSASVIQQRLINNDKTNRPIIKEVGEFEMLEFIQQHIGQREQYYLQADYIFIGDTVEELIAFLRN